MIRSSAVPVGEISPLRPPPVLAPSTQPVYPGGHGRHTPGQWTVALAGRGGSGAGRLGENSPPAGKRREAGRAADPWTPRPHVAGEATRRGTHRGQGRPTLGQWAG